MDIVEKNQIVQKEVTVIDLPVQLEILIAVVIVVVVIGIIVYRIKKKK